MREWIAVSVIGRDRPGIVASVSKVLYLNHCNIEELSQTAIKGQFAMILIASALKEEARRGLKDDLQELARALALDINLRKIKAEEMTPFSSGAIESFVITVRGEDRPGLVYGITEVLAGQGINITNLDAQVARIGGKSEYIQLYEVDIPKTLDLSIIQEKLRQRGQEMGVAVDLQHREIFRAINQI
ncbi:MAG: amino acid-binding protein [Deltaproteobacteria bacterium]|nr:amino acid-binding protein [Deltaproteobacteria bacterium]